MQPKDITFVLEGHTEVVFLRHLLELLLPGDLSIQTVKLGKDRNVKSLSERISNPAARYKFTLIDAGSDSNVIPALEVYGKPKLKDSEAVVIGLRDMYCDSYDKAANGKIEDRVSNEFHENAEIALSIIRGRDPGVMQHFFSIMEIECWFIAMSGVLKKLGSRFNDQLFSKIDNMESPEGIYKPGSCLEKIYNQAGSRYTKSEGCIESLVANITYEDITELRASNKATSFNTLHDALLHHITT